MKKNICFAQHGRWGRHLIIFIKTRISNYIHGLIWDLNAYPCPNFGGGLTKPLLNQGNVEVLYLTFHINIITDPGPNHDARLVPDSKIHGANMGPI